MKNAIFLPALLAGCLACTICTAQTVKSTSVPAAVKAALQKKYPAATNVTWEKEKGNFEASWGGRSHEDNSVLFTPEGSFVEQVVAMPVGSLPPNVASYVKRTYPGMRITEAGKVTDAAGKTRYEAEVKGKDLIFDESGNFMKND